VRIFDTSNIYGQGDSERLLGEVVAGRDDAVIVSKAGKYLTPQRRILVPIKGVVRASTRRSSNAKDKVKTIRARPMPTRWDVRFLTKSLEGSLRRLKRERIEVFLLHSPGVDIISTGDAVSALELARTAGKIGVVGVSVDDTETALACLADKRIRVLELPIPPGESRYGDVLTRAAEAGVAVVAREILGGATAIAEQHDSASVARARIIEMVHDPQIAVPLVGATRIETLAASIEAVRQAIRPCFGSVQPVDEGDVSG
jgi:aryl-alcohol dehydrogenase-like predicted oxidoreductase